ncbi:hypothetical protein [uncultured Kordia sp.]|uniref:hypothetical protein n=1 Tax=uncultured Kordia sp. TaxID=507699 RepID=UPI0026266ADA|nr:hypothetical protein [uncultured Kordia sp.]
MIFTKKIGLLFLYIVFVNLSFGQEKPPVVIEEIEELPAEEIKADAKHASNDKKRQSKRPASSYNTFRYEFVQNGNEIIYVSIKNEAKQAQETIEVIPVKNVDGINVLPYNFGYEYHRAKSHEYDIERHYHENYLVYKYRKKYGLILDADIISAKFDTIGKPYLLRCEKPMMLVAKKKQGKYQWGIVKSDGNFLLPMEYDEIIIPLEMDTSMNSYEDDRKKQNKLWNDSNAGLYSDGLYHNQKIIVKKNDKYGLFNANGEVALDLIYDNIEVDNFLGVYTLQKDNESGFLIAEYKKIGVWGTNKIIEKNTNVNEYLKVFPTKDYQIFIKEGLIYIKYNTGIISKIDHHALMKMIKEN